MTGKRPRLYPSHQHTWADPEQVSERRSLVRCTICGFEAPRTLANLDGKPADDAVYDEPELCGICGEELIWTTLAGVSGSGRWLHRNPPGAADLHRPEPVVPVTDQGVAT